MVSTQKCNVFIQLQSYQTVIVQSTLVISKSKGLTGMRTIYSEHLKTHIYVTLVKICVVRSNIIFKLFLFHFIFNMILLQKGQLVTSKYGISQLLYDQLSENDFFSHQ